MNRAARFAFLHLGTLVGVVVYFALREATQHQAAGVQRALVVALLVHSAYMALARWAGELKQFDWGLWLMFAVGATGIWAGSDLVFILFWVYSPAVLFATLALTALLPPLFGAESFTAHFARRQLPHWQHGTPAFRVLNRFFAWFWAALFAVCAVLAAREPLDWRFTFLIPNLLIFLVGVPAPRWLGPLYARVVRIPMPETVEPLILGMPLVFDSHAAGDADATIQFRVTGPQAGDWHLRVARGRCESFAGCAASPHLTIHTPDSVWIRIARGELDGTAALGDGLYRVEGDLMVLAKLPQWFPSGR